jgi:predicted ThiF/HesA family dinucleotide-utilizing enzyme
MLFPHLTDSVTRFSLARFAASAFGATALAGATALVGAPGLAQSAAPAGAAAKPASLETMNAMALAAAVNVCELAVDQKVPVQNAVISNAKAITYVVTATNGSQIAGAGKLEASQIVNGTIVQIVGRVKQGCYPKITTADKKFVDDVIAQFSAQAKQQPKK